MDGIPNRTACERAATECVCFNLRKTARSITGVFDAALRGTGLRVTQFSLLNALRLAGPVPVTPLAETLAMDRTTLTRNLSSLEREGFVRAEAGADRRIRLLELTPAGAEALARALPAWERAQDQVVGQLGAGRWGTLLTELSALGSLARGAGRDGSAKQGRVEGRKEEDDGC